jgi:hypothetical protein
VAAEATPPPPPPPPAEVISCTSPRGTLVVCYALVWWRRGVACQGCLSAAWVGYCAYWACTCVFDGPQCTGGAAKQENEKQGNQNSLRDLLPSMWLVMCKRPKETGMHIKRSAILAPPLSAGEGGGGGGGLVSGIAVSRRAMAVRQPASQNIDDVALYH